MTNIQFYSLVCWLFICVGGFAEDMTMVEPRDTGEVLINPSMGWTANRNFLSQTSGRHVYCVR